MLKEIEFEILARRHSDEIFRYARSLLGDAGEAEDATQEALLKLWRDLPKVRLGAARAWLYRTTRNHCIDVIRRRSGGRLSLLEEADTIEETLATDEPSPLEALSLDELRERLDGALQQVPEPQRSIFVLYEINGMRYREIAKILDLPINTVKVYLSRGRAKLRRTLTEDFPCATH